MPQLRLMTEGPSAGGHAGEVFSVAFTPDGRFVLSGGWDGHLRLWEVSTGAPVTALAASAKAISACAVAPDGRHWMSGALDGMLAAWGSATHQQASVQMAHTRPISAIHFSADGRTVATASWDRTIGLWARGGERDVRLLAGHGDVVAGCRFTPDGRHLFSWSHDGTARAWDLAGGQSVAVLGGPGDRLSAGAVSPDGLRAATAGRDRLLTLWDLRTERPERTARLGGEARACFFLLDGESLVTVDGHGRVVLHSVPDLAERQELPARLPVQCAELAPAGDVIALGCDDGRVRRVALAGHDTAPAVVTPTRAAQPKASRLARLLGRPPEKPTYSCTCPTCRRAFEVPDEALGRPADCPGCARTLRINRAARAAPQP